MLPDFRFAYSGNTPSPLPANARTYPFRVRSPLPTSWNARGSRATDTPSSFLVSLASSPNARTTASDFIQKHTKPGASRESKGVCPICLDAYSTEECLQITGIAGCRHHIGGTCLKDMLKYHPTEEKKCPLCRTVWIRGDSPAPSPPPRRHTLGHTANALRAINHGRLGTALGRARFENARSSNNRFVSRRTRLPRLSAHRYTANLCRPVPLGQRQEVSSIESLSDMSISGNEQLPAPADNTAEIRRRAENTQYHRRVGRRQHQLENFYAENHFGPSSDDQPVEPTRSGAPSSETHTAAISVFDRIRNARVLNPFRPAISETAPSAATMSAYVSSNDTRGEVVRAQRQPSARVSELRGPSGRGPAATNTRQNNMSSAFASDSHASTRMASSEASADVPTAPSDYQLLSTRHWYDTVSHRQRRLDQREEMLDAREEVVNSRLRSVMDWEADIREREDRVKHALELVKGQRDELEELLRRQTEALERLLGWEYGGG